MKHCIFNLFEESDSFQTWYSGLILSKKIAEIDIIYCPMAKVVFGNKFIEERELMLQFTKQTRFFCLSVSSPPRSRQGWFEEIEVEKFVNNRSSCCTLFQHAFTACFSIFNITVLVRANQCNYWCSGAVYRCWNSMLQSANSFIYIVLL